MKYSRIAILVFLLLYQAKTFAQEEITNHPSKFEFHISAGAGIPLGKFADFQDDGDDGKLIYSPGAAKTGFNIKLGLDYYFTLHSGLAAMFCITGNNGVSMDSADFFYQSYDDGENFDYTFDPGTWKSCGFFAGYTLRKPMGKFQANVALMVGVMQMTAPKMTLNYSYTYERNVIWGGTNLKEYTWNQHADKSTALAGDVALKLQYQTGKKLAVFFSMDYMFSGTSFKGSVDNNVMTTVYLTEDLAEYYKYQDSWTNDYSFKKNVSLLGLNAGISYLLF